MWRPASPATWIGSAGTWLTELLRVDSSPIPPELSQKILGGPHALQEAQALARPLVFTNGVFDVLHTGHVVYLARARALGGALLVALNSDSSARRQNKGPDRPLNNESDRALVLAALQSVSAIMLFDEATPCELLSRCRPDIYVKGGDYDIESLQETKLVRSWGGRAAAIDFVAGYSTTALVSRIRSGS
jgi:D-glycero-beta-D-manno-heptose 1-phosphate adenylyltransferase